MHRERERDTHTHTHTHTHSDKVKRIFCGFGFFWQFVLASFTWLWWVHKPVKSLEKLKLGKKGSLQIPFSFLGSKYFVSRV